uniref:Uncharacterized protein n=1 Tax=Glossina austeni TaxID=7395 RepID=A0A1A9VTG7_GLOAU
MISELIDCIGMEDTNSSDGMEIKYFKATSIHPPHYYNSLQQGAKIEERRADIDEQINSLLHNVHTNLREQKLRKIAKRIQKASELKEEEKEEEEEEEEEEENANQPIDI